MVAAASGFPRRCRWQRGLGEGESTLRAIEAQKRFYELRAPDYLTGAASDRGGNTPDAGLSESERRALVDELSPTGEVLELGCGPGGFTRELARHALSVTAVDASPQMLARNEMEVAQPNVRYVAADIFEWQPEATYDVVFFGFLLSHVPPAAFDSFWGLVRSAVREGGRVAFVDEDDRAIDNDEVRVLDGVPVARRKLRDGQEFDVIKVFWNPEELAVRLHQLDWDVTVHRVGQALLYGVGVGRRA
jgi:demethylmenaquinone methyltransferase/2-methoxy-6-polyprenyl-1,4-benzoquinol methylase